MTELDLDYLSGRASAKRLAAPLKGLFHSGNIERKAAAATGFLFLGLEAIKKVIHIEIETQESSNAKKIDQNNAKGEVVRAYLLS